MAVFTDGITAAYVVNNVQSNNSWQYQSFELTA